MQRRKSLFEGMALLTLSGIAVKFCSLLFKIPLVSIIGDEGMGYFNSAYVLYNFFFVFSTAGLPVALSILISKAENERIKRQYLKTALFLVGLVGVLLSLVLTLFPRRLAGLVGNESAYLSVKVMGPTLLFVTLSGAFRGYFQGKRDMMPTALSQMTEAFLKTAFGISFSYFLMKQGYNRSVAAAGALLGITFGSFCSFILLLMLYHKKKGTLSKEDPKEKRSTVFRNFLRTMVPISAASSVMSISSILDLSVIMGKLQSLGYDEVTANTLYGNYSGLAIPLFTLPSMLIAPVVSAVLPYLSEAEEKKDLKKRERLSIGAVSLASLISAPCFFGLLLHAYPILALLFEDSSAENAAPLLCLLSPSVYLLSLSSVSGALLQGGGHEKLPMLSLFLGGTVKVLSTYFLMEHFELAGAPMGTFLCYLAVTILNFTFVFRIFHFHFPVVKTFLLPLFAGGTASLLGKCLYKILLSYMGNRFSILISVGCTAVLYGGSLYLLGVLKGNFSELLPSKKMKKIKIKE